MPRDEKGFLDAIRQEPDNADLWSIYTDWLEERGDPRSPLFRRHLTNSLGMRLVYVPAVAWTDQ